ncbi:UNVERIFIED_CONTAM: hypothetical protein Sindi_2790800 [Sesamum indicum]
MSSHGRVVVEAKEDEGSNVVDKHDDEEELSNEKDDFTSPAESELGDDAFDSISEEDYLIEIRPPEKWVEADQEDNLIEIDISMGSITT